MIVHAQNREFDVPLNDSCKWVRELMSSDYIQLSWKDIKGDYLPTGTYIEYEGNRYILLDDYYPKRDNETSWSYEPKFESLIMALSKVPFFFYNYDDSGNIISREIDWSLTAQSSLFLMTIAECIKNELNLEFGFSTDAAGSKTITFSSVDILSALNSIANEFETEWWFDGGKIHLSKCKLDEEPITLKVGESVGAPSITEKSEGYYNKFYVFGSTRNIIQDYKGSNVNNLVNKRLTLDPVKYPDGCYQLSEGEFSKILIFEDIYPSATNLFVTDIRGASDYVIDEATNKRKQIGTDDNGDPIYDIYTNWYIKVSHKNEDGTYTDFTFNNWNYSEDPNVKDGKSGMKIPGLSVSINFVSGYLMGREFELKYIESDSTVANLDGTMSIPKGFFKVLYTKENDYIIPDSLFLAPNIGDNVVIFNIKMPDSYIQDAYDRLEKAMLKELDEKYLADLNQYKVNSYPDVFNDKNIKLKIGSPIRFIVDETHKTLDTRVSGISVRLDYPFIQEITLGNEILKGTIQQIVDSTTNANRDISIISNLNSSTSALANSYNRAYQELSKLIDRYDSMFGVDKDGDIYVKNGKGFYTEGFISAGKKGTTGGGGTGGGGFTQWSFSDILNMTEEEGEMLGNLAAAYAVKESYEQTKTDSIPIADIEKMFY